MWTVLTWIFIPILGYYFGATGASVGYCLVGASSVLAIYIAKKYVAFSIVDSMLKPLVGTIIMTAAIVVAKRFIPANFYGLQVLILLGIVSYGASMTAMVGMSLLEDAKKSVKTFFSKG